MSVGTSTATAVVAVAALFAAPGSVVPLVSVTVFEMVEPAAAAALTFTTTVNVDVAPAANVAMAAVTVPVPPTGGVVKVQAGPEFCSNETNVVFAGTVSLSVTLAAFAGPAFAIVIV